MSPICLECLVKGNCSWVCYSVLNLWAHIITVLLLMRWLRNRKQEPDLFCSGRQQCIRRKFVFHQVKSNAYERDYSHLFYLHPRTSTRQDNSSRVCSKLLSSTNRLAIPFTAKLSPLLLFSRKFFAVENCTIGNKYIFTEQSIPLVVVVRIENNKIRTSYNIVLPWQQQIDQRTDFFIYSRVSQLILSS